MTTLLRWIIFAGACCLLVWVFEAGPIDTAVAHDFGGSTSPDPSPDPPEDPPPCKKNPPCLCQGGGGGGGGDNGGDDNGSDGPPNAGHEGQPISLWTGAENHNQTDLVLSGVYPIRLARSYQSRSRFDSALGYGWAFDHDRRLFEYPDDSALIRYSCGQTMRFVRTGGAYVTPLDGPQGDLVEQPDGTFEFVYYDGNTDVFDADGRIVEAIHREGHRHEYIYDPRGKLPLTGTSPYAVDPDQPMIVAYMSRLTRIQERSADGQLTGTYIDFTYDETTGRITQAQAHDGRTIVYTHDTTADQLTQGNLIRVEGPDSLFFEYEYTSPHGNHLLTSMQEGVNSEPIVNTYDDQQRVTRQTHGFQVLDFDYQVPKVRTQVTRTIADEQGNLLHSAVSTVHFDVQGYVTKRVNALGHELRFFYDASKDVDRVEWWDNHTGTLTLARTVNYSHDSKGRLLSAATTLASGETITKTWTYDHGWMASEQSVSSVEPSKTFRMEYTFIRDAQNRPRRIHQIKQIGDGGTNRITTYSYCTTKEIGQPGSTCPFEGLLKTIDGPRTDVSDVTTFAYYAATDTSGCGQLSGNCYRKGQLHTITNALGQTQEVLRYNLAGDVVRTNDSNNVIADFEYNQRRWLTAVKVRGDDPVSETDDQITRLDYNSNGDLIKQTAPDGSFTAFAYDSRNRLTGISDNLGNTITYTLDSEGNRLKQDTADSGSVLSHSLSATFDPLNRMLSQSTPPGGTTTVSYDYAGNAVSLQDPIPGQSPTVQQYDALNRLIQSTDPASGISQYDYNAIDIIKSVTDPNSHTTTYTYNALGNLTQLFSPDTGLTAYEYDSAGNRSAQVDARSVRTEYQHDALGRTIALTYPQNTALNIAYDYDTVQPNCPTGEQYPIGRLTRITDASGETRYCYDRWGNRTRKVQTTDGVTLELVYTYTDNNQIARITYPSGHEVAYIYDSAGQVDQVTLQPPGGMASSLLSQVDYAPFGPLSTLQFANGLDLNYNHNQAYWLEAITSSTAPGLNYAFDHDAVGNITQINEGPIVRDLIYDDVYRLIEFDDEAKVGQPLLSYMYDAVGNRLQKQAFDGALSTTSYTYAANSNRLQSVDGQSRSYDTAGNTTTGHVPNGQTASVQSQYDERNRLNQATITGWGSADYNYNGHGERVWKQYIDAGQTVTVRFIYSEQGQLLAEQQTGGPAAGYTEYILLNRRPVALIRDGQLYYLQSDHLGTPRRVIEPSTNSIQWHWPMAGEPFGDHVPDENPNKGGTSFKLNLRFPGQYFDEETGTHYNYFRDYEPGTGRYVQSDPIGLWGGLNTYAYALDSPLMFIDLWGLQSSGDCPPDHPENDDIPEFNPDDVITGFPPIAGPVRALRGLFGYKYPTKLNRAGKPQPYDPSTGRYRSYSDNLGFRYSPVADFLGGFSGGVGESHGIPSAPPLSFTGRLGYFLGRASSLWFP